MSNWIHYNNNPRTLTALGKLIELIEKDKIKMNKKKMFYVGSSTVVESNYLKTTMQEAIESAKHLVKEQGGTRYVVKVVAIVREASKPIQVEIIK